MTHQSPLRSRRLTQRITDGSVLCLDIDGVLAPVEDLQSPFPQTPEGFVKGARGVEVHSRMSGWIDRLVEAFDTVVWNSSWDTCCAEFADSVGLQQAVGWDLILGSGSIAGAGYNGRKAAGPLVLTDPSVPLMLVDDNFYRFNTQDIAALLSRPGPTLIVCPNNRIGLAESLVDRMCQWARNPTGSPKIWTMYGSPNYGYPVWTMPPEGTDLENYVQAEWTNGYDREPDGWPHPSLEWAPMHSHYQLFPDRIGPESRLDPEVADRLLDQWAGRENPKPGWRSLLGFR